MLPSGSGKVVEARLYGSLDHWEIVLFNSYGDRKPLDGVE